MSYIKKLIDWVKEKLFGKVVIGWDIGSNDKSVVVIGRVKNGVIKIVDVKEKNNGR